MSLSVLIVNWNSRDFLRDCLRSLQINSAGFVTQIVVVDSGSFDGCGEMISAEFPMVEFIQSTTNLGFGRSNNLGFKRILGEYLLLLNPDTEIRPLSVETLLQSLKKCPNAGLVAPRLFNKDASVQYNCVRALPTPLNRAVDGNRLRRWVPRSRLWGNWAALHALTPVAVEAVSGACMMLRSEVFNQLGGFNPAYFMYGEDMDLCARVKKLGLQVYHVPEATVMHFSGGSSRKQISEFSTVMMRVAAETYMRLNHGIRTAMFYRLLQGVSALIRLSLLIPSVFTLHGEKKKAAAVSLRKWWIVLRWVVGCSGSKISNFSN